MEFRSTSGNVERLVLPSGAVALVDTSWGGLPPQFHREAYAHGCESDDMLANRSTAQMSEGEKTFVKGAFSKKANIKTAMISLLEKGDVSDFTFYKRDNEYRPRTASITTLVGSRVMNSERDAIWYKMLEDGTTLPEFS